MNIIPIPLLPSKTFVLYILFPCFFSRCDGLVYNISFLHICWYFVSGSWRTEFSGRTAHSSLVINLNLFKIEKYFLKNREGGFIYNFSLSFSFLFQSFILWHFMVCTVFYFSQLSKSLLDDCLAFILYKKPLRLQSICKRHYKNFDPKYSRDFLRTVSLLI